MYYKNHLTQRINRKHEILVGHKRAMPSNKFRPLLLHKILMHSNLFTYPNDFIQVFMKAITKKNQRKQIILYSSGIKRENKFINWEAWK